MNPQELNREEIYFAWKRRRSSVQPGPDFADGVMRQIYASSERRHKSVSFFQHCINWISQTPLAQAAAIAAAAAAALVEGIVLVRVGLG